VFFAKKILFVEGIVDYILFNNLLREKLKKELKEVEIIPIFGKFHYIFFHELAK
jgi:predicted ATP-dependent endonuclease of OLD family